MEVSNDISYFTVRLLELLTESYPELASDKEFVDARSNAALEVYNEAITQGNNHLEATHLANEVLFGSLPFSKMDMLFDVVCNEFSNDIEDDKLRLFAEKMYPVCQSIFNRYDTTTIENESAQYDLLYTELTGTIQIWLEANTVHT